MELLKSIEETIMKTMKEGNALKTDTLRMLKTDIMYEKTKKGDDLTDEQILEVISRAAKKRKEAIVEFEKAGRTEMAQKESDELLIIEEYLPEMMSEAEIEKIIGERISEMGEVTQKDFGRVMGPIMKELKGKADGQVVKRIVTEKLK